MMAMLRRSARTEVSVSMVLDMFIPRGTRAWLEGPWHKKTRPSKGPRHRRLATLERSIPEEWPGQPGHVAWPSPMLTRALAHSVWALTTGFGSVHSDACDAVALCAIARYDRCRVDPA